VGVLVWLMLFRVSVSCLFSNNVWFFYVELHSTATFQIFVVFNQCPVSL